MLSYVDDEYLFHSNVYLQDVHFVEVMTRKSKVKILLYKIGKNLCFKKINYNNPVIESRIL